MDDEDFPPPVAPSIIIHPDDLNVLALVKGSDRYLFIFDDANRENVRLKMGQFASHPDLNFSWYDAAVLSQRLRQQANACEMGRPARA